MPKRKYTTKKQLVASCKRMRLDVNPCTLRNELIATRERYAMSLIVRSMRKHLLWKSRIVNSEDPITLEPVPSAVRWLVWERGSVYQFDAVAMVEYLTSTAIFNNPLTRCVFSARALADLERVYRRSHSLPYGTFARTRAASIEHAAIREFNRTMDFMHDAIEEYIYNTQIDTFPEYEDFKGRILGDIEQLEMMSMARGRLCLIQCVCDCVSMFNHTTLPWQRWVWGSMYHEIKNRLHTVHGTLLVSPFLRDINDAGQQSL
jgi:hypothetical protein